MYLLYLDESGSVRSPNERHFILAGMAVFERPIYYLINSVDAYVARFASAGDGELHANVMARGKEHLERACRGRTISPHSLRMPNRSR